MIVRIAANQFPTAFPPNPKVRLYHFPFKFRQEAGLAEKDYLSRLLNITYPALRFPTSKFEKARPPLGLLIAGKLVAPASTSCLMPMLKVGLLKWTICPPGQFVSPVTWLVNH